MPIYEYKCKDCGIYFEKRQKVSDERLKVCENCGGTLEKQWSPPAIQFRGEGWYVTDYAGKKNDSRSAEKSDGGESTASAAEASKPKTDGGAESKKKD